MNGDKPVIVAELIAHLQTLPQELPVVFRQFSELSPLTLENIRTTEIVDQGGYYSVSGAMYVKVGQTRIQAVVFPGN